jgi:hypothetical protein
MSDRLAKRHPTQFFAKWKRVERPPPGPSSPTVVAK